MQEAQVNLFFLPAVAFTQTYFCNHITSFEVQWEANRKQLCYTKNNTFQIQHTEIPALLGNRKLKVFMTVEGLAWM